MKSKTINIGLILLFLEITWVLTILANPDIQQHFYLSQNKDTIDNLIVTKALNAKTILVKFGADAVTAINTKFGIIVIDAGISTGLTSRYKTIIENEFTGYPVKYVINTHYHPDHYGGNSVFIDAKIIGHTNGVHEISEQWKDTTIVRKNMAKIVSEYTQTLPKCERNSTDWIEAFTQKTRYLSALQDVDNHIQVRPPDITFSDSLTMEVGEMTIEMIYFGRCHSNSDILIYIPQLEILFTGDLLFKYGRPSMAEKSLQDKELWKNAINWTISRIPYLDIIVTGHGEILTIDDLKAFKLNIMDICANPSEE